MIWGNLWCSTMSSDPPPNEKGKYLATNSPEVNFGLLLSSVIESIKDDPAQLRNAIYELARVQLQREAWQRNPPMNILEMRRLMLALETAIERVETISSQEGGSRTRQFTDQLFVACESSPNNSVADQCDPTVSIDQSPLETRFAAPYPVVTLSERSVLYHRRRIWPSLAPLLGGSIVGIIVVALLDWQFFGLMRQEPIDAVVPAIRTEAPERVPVVQAHSLGTQPDLPALPRPSVYGVYAITNGALSELEALPVRVPDPKVFMSTLIKAPSRTILPDGRIVFIVYRRDIATSAPDRVAIRAIAKIKRAMTYTAGRPSTAILDDQWAIRSTSYEFRVAPLSESSEMLVIRPELFEFVLPAGRYGLVLKGQAYDFTVAGSITEAAQCLERIEAANGAFYSECRNP
jgi:hypothetical protein